MVWQVLIKLIAIKIQELAIVLWGTDPRNEDITFTYKCSEVLFPTDKNTKQLPGSSMSEWLNSLVYSYHGILHSYKQTSSRVCVLGQRTE